MKTWKWRIVLAVANLFLAVGMSAVGARQWATDRNLHPEYFYHGNLYYIPTAQWLSYCLNVPSFAAVNLAGNFTMSYHLLPSGWFGTYCFYFVHYEYYLALFLFWWWVGWKIDMKLTPHEYRTLWIVVVEALLGTVVSIALLFQGVVALRSWATIHAIAYSMVVWGAVLLLYFVGCLWRIPSWRLAQSG
jgi:hypothetical protein